MDNLTTREKQFINIIKSQLSIVADISRAEVLLYGPLQGDKTRVLSHLHPHSVAPAYLKSYADVAVDAEMMPVVIKTLKTRRRSHGPQGKFGDGASVMLDVWPIFTPDRTGKVIGAVSIDASLIEHERQRRRSTIFQKAVRRIQFMLTRGLLKNAESLSPFGENEGIIVVDKDGYIRYTSGVAANLYRRLGYLDSLIGRQLENLQTRDYELFNKTMATARCVERESEDGGRNWIRKTIPIYSRPNLLKRLQHFLKRKKTKQILNGALLIVHDITEDRRNEQELRIKNAMIQEIHHRVKNNLQTIAALLRIQSRRIEDKAATLALQDAINRILSIAVIHEFLSDEGEWNINLKDVCQRIITQTQSSIIWPDNQITFQLEGTSIWLPPRQATACALVINELLQNALEHGFGYHHKTGSISIILTDEGDHVIITIEDDGHGLPENFDQNSLKSLGLQIAKTLVTEDLQGDLNLANHTNGTTATITFPKATFGGEEGWNGNES